MEVAAEANLLDLDLARTKDFRGTAERIVPWLVEALDEVSVKSDFWGEELRIPHRIFVAGGAVQPGPVSVRKRGLRVHRGSLRGLGCSGFTRRWHHRPFLLDGCGARCRFSGLGIVLRPCRYCLGIGSWGCNGGLIGGRQASSRGCRRCARFPACF